MTTQLLDTYTPDGQPSAPPPTAAAPEPTAVTPTAGQPAAPSSPPPPETSAADLRLRALEAELEFYRGEAAEGKLREKAVAYKMRLESDGWPPELAVIQARTWYEREAAVEERDTMRANTESQAKTMVAARLGREFGVPAHLLASYPTPQAMLAAATQLAADAKRLSALESELAAFKKGAVGPQTFDQGTGGTGTSDEAFLTLYSQGQSHDHPRAKKLLGL